MPNANDRSELVLYQTEDGITRIHVRLVDGSVWLTQRQLAALYQVTVPAISQHINHIFEEGSSRQRSCASAPRLTNRTWVSRAGAAAAC